MKEIQSRKISRILKKLGKLDRNGFSENGKLSIEKFNEHPEVKKSIEELKDLGIENSNQLSIAGYPAAGMILKF